MSFQARASSRSSSPSSPKPKRRATLSARRELWMRGGDSSDEEPPPSGSARGGVSADADLFEAPPKDPNTSPFQYSLGKSCVVVEDKRANTNLCGFQLQGSDKTCFNTNCTIRAHRTPEAESPVVQPGVYFRSGLAGLAATRVFNSPVADLAILNPYADLLSRIVEFKGPTWENILSLMAELEDLGHCENQVRLITSVVDREQGEDTSMNPPDSSGEQSDSDASEGDDMAELDQAMGRSTQKRTLIPNSMSLALAGFESLVVTLGKEKEVDLASDVGLPRILQLLLERTDLMATAIHLLKRQLPGLQQLAAGSDDTFAKCLTMEAMVLKPAGASYVNRFSNLWDLGDHTMASQTKSEQKLRKAEAKGKEQDKHLDGIEDELSQILQAFERLKKRVKEVRKEKQPRKERHWGEENDTLTRSRGQVGDQERFNLLESGLQDLMKRVEDLLTGKPASSARVVPFGGGFLRTVSCVKALIERTDDPGSIAGFADPFQFFARLKQIIDGEDSSLTDSMKMKKLAQELNRSEEECRHMSVASQRKIAFFTGSRKVGKTEYSGKGFGSYKEWRDESNGVGTAYDIERALVTVEEEFLSIIEDAYPPVMSGESMRDLPLRVLSQSVSFIKKLVYWTDSTYRTLTINHTPADQAWWIITKIWRALFEDFLGPTRVIPGGVTSQENDKSARYIWTALQTHMLCKELEDKEIKNHHVVHGVYSEWLVAHSGRKEADLAMGQAAKATKELEDMKIKFRKMEDQMDSLKKKVTETKGVADRAIGLAKNSKSG